MLGLKTILRSNLTYVVLFIIISIYVIINLSINNRSKYIGNEKSIQGEVIDYKVYNNRVSILIKGKEKILINIYNKIDIRFGDIIRVNGNLKIPSNNTIPSTFNYKKYLLNNDIYYIFDANSINILKSSNKPLYKLKNSLYKRINKADVKGYLKALIMGNKSNLEYYTYYQDIGVSHMFAISGMHVSLLALVIMKVFNKFKLKHIILDIIIFVYGSIILFPASIKRVLGFIIIKQINNYYKFNISNMKILIIDAFILILLDYKIIFDISFVYSFVCVFSVIYTSDRFNSTNKVFKLFKTSFVVFIFSLPISLFYYNCINIFSVLFNILYIPFITFIIYPLCVLTFFIPYTGFILLLFINILENITLFISDIGSLLYFSINWWQLIVYYFLLYMVINHNFKCLGLLVIFVLIIKNSFLFDGNDYVYYFDVGQGDSSLIITSYGRDVVLIDSGGNSFNKEYHVSDNIINFLHSKGINTITTFVITHGDYDHMGEAINLVNNFKVEKVIFNCGPYNDLEKELIKVLDKKKIKYYSCIKELNIDNNKLYFLQTKEFDNENDNSNVIYTELSDYKFMFMGDASITTEKEILKKYNLPDIDVLKVGHHGSKTSSSEIFVNEVNPKYSIISVGKNNRYGHPNKEVLDNLENSKIYRTDHDGSIMFKIKNNKLKIETCVP